MSHPTPPIRPVDQQELSVRGRRITLFVLLGALLLAGTGLFFWITGPSTTSTADPITTSQRPSWEQNQEPETPTAQAEVRGLSAVSSSHELSAIAADLESTRLRNLNAEFNAIEAILRP